MIEGELTFATVRGWLERADELAGTGQLDLAKVTKVDSAGAAFLLELTRRAKRREQGLTLVNASQSLRRLIEFLQIDDALKLA